jgi:hypothetical protein
MPATTAYQVKHLLLNFGLRTWVGKNLEIAFRKISLWMPKNSDLHREWTKVKFSECRDPLDYRVRKCAGLSYVLDVWTLSEVNQNQAHDQSCSIQVFANNELKTNR